MQRAALPPQYSVLLFSRLRGPEALSAQNSILYDSPSDSFSSPGRIRSSLVGPSASPLFPGTSHPEVVTKWSQNSCSSWCVYRPPGAARIAVFGFGERAAASLEISALPVPSGSARYVVSNFRRRASSVVGRPCVPMWRRRCDPRSGRIPGPRGSWQRHITMYHQDNYADSSPATAPTCRPPGRRSGN